MQDIDIDDLSTGGDLLTAAMITAAVYLGLVLVPAIVIFCIVVKCRTHRCLSVMIIVTLSVEFALGLVVMILSLIASAKYSERAKILKDLDKAVQGCMDSNWLLWFDFEATAEDGNLAAALLTVFAVFIVIKIIVSLIIGCCIMSKMKPK